MTPTAWRTGLVILTAVVLGCAHKPETARLGPAALTYFQDSYEQCRGAFRELVVSMGQQSPGLEVTVLAVPSARDSDLTIDLAYFPAAEAGRLLLLTSAVHGIEGYTGSAVQQLFIAEHLRAYLARGVSVLLVHGINPHGFRHQRRVTENNVDLNRNFSTNSSLYRTENEGYGKLSDVLNPTEPVEAFGQDQLFFLKTAYLIPLHGLKNLRQAVMQGQYQLPRGLYFGGEQSEPQRYLLEPLFEYYFEEHQRILLVDLHTGYGERGRLHFFPSPVPQPARRNELERIFKGYQIDYGDTEDFYTTHGDFTDYVGALVPEPKLYVPMCFEYGTVDSHKTMGSIHGLLTMVLENQGHHYGYRSEGDRTQVRRRFREMYYPSSPAWREAVVEQSRELFEVVAERFGGR